jgi:LuxR family transcriptional regulator, maltose regulon positive regulatory protein
MRFASAGTMSTTAAPDNNTSLPLNARRPRFASSKFSPPKAVTNLVPRTRLLEQLDRTEHHRLTLVVATAGAGKTTLLVEWLAARPTLTAAWLNCDEADIAPVRFVFAVVESLRRATDVAGLGEDALQLLSLDSVVSADALAALAGDLEDVERPLLLVVDDFHLTGPETSRALSLLLDYRPPSFQLVLATRADPLLRLARMRANEELVELRDHDLSFSTEETGLLLAGFDLQLDEADVALVHDRSEGWAAGLQMAALSIQRSPDQAQAAGRVEIHRHTVAGYFLDEVLSRQPPEVADFMLATSILDELSVGSCAALCADRSRALLEYLFTWHLFVAMVDEKAPTYRYHHLVRDVLRAELHARDPAREEQLHREAATYFGRVGQVGEAVRHLLAAGDRPAAVNLLTNGVIRDFALNPRLASPLDLDEASLDTFADAPEMLLPLAAGLFLRGVYERGSHALRLVRRTAIDPERQPELAIELISVEAMESMFIGDLDRTLAFIDRAKKLGGRRGSLDESWFANLDSGAAYCYAFLGDLDRAREWADAFVSEFGTDSSREVIRPSVLSQAAWAEGVLDEAGAFATQALGSARRLGFGGHYFTYCALRTQALLALERRDLDTAAELNEQALRMVAAGGRPYFDYLAQLDRARIWATRGDVDSALASLPAARTTLRSNRSPLLPQADELEARFRLRLGDLRGAETATARLPVDRAQVLSAMIFLAADDPRGAEGTLSGAPTSGPTTRGEVELRLLRAAIATRLAPPTAPQLVRHALVLVERLGFLQTVLDTAPQFADHLVESGDSYPPGKTLANLVAARLDDRRRSVRAARRRSLPDPLTEAEIRVLQKLSERLSYVDIASELHLSLNTVKTHLRHVYMKLDATSRASAVKRAAVLGLI